MNPATKCLAKGSRGYHDWGGNGQSKEGYRKEICSYNGCACIRQIDATGAMVPGTFNAS